jgi:hypothetical protein
MSQPSLPPGYRAQPFGHRLIGGVSFEFHRAYGPDGVLDRDRSFWQVTEMDDLGRLRSRILSFADHGKRPGAGEAKGFADFAAPSHRPERILGWLDAAGVQPVDVASGLSSTPAAEVA